MRGSLDVLDVLATVLIVHVARWDLELEARTEVLDVFVVRHVLVELESQSDSGFVGPRSADVLNPQKERCLRQSQFSSIEGESEESREK